MTALASWKQNVTALSVIYNMLERGKRISTLLEGDDSFLAPVLDDMYRQGLLDIDRKSNEYVVTKQGRDLRGSMVAMYDQLLKFEIFAHVSQSLQLTGVQSEDGVNVFPDLLDPRFTPTPQSEDLRLAMLTWYGESAANNLDGAKVDPYQVVYMQKLRAGHYNNSDFWFNLRVGKVFQEIEQIVDTAVKWQDLGNDVQEASDAMNTIYSCGMQEQIKRDGERCQCGAYLGMFEYYAQKEGKQLTECPCCYGSFTPPQPIGEACPNCNYDIFPKQRKCRGCGAKIDRSLAAGTVTEVTTETTSYETYYNPWSSSYLSYGYCAPAPLYYNVWYDPFDPIANVASFALVCALL